MRRIRQDKSNAIGSLIIGVVVAIAALVLLAGLWRAGNWLVLVIVAMFLVVGVVKAGSAVWGLALRPALVGRSFSPASAMLSRDWLAVGECLTLWYKRRVHAEVEIRRVLIRLILRETATYSNGSSTFTVTHDNVIDVCESPGWRARPGDMIREERTLAIPVGSMHTFEAPHNKLAWLIQVQIDAPVWPKDWDEFPIVIQAARSGR